MSDPASEQHVRHGRPQHVSDVFLYYSALTNCITITSVCSRIQSESAMSRYCEQVSQSISQQLDKNADDILENSNAIATHKAKIEANIKTIISFLGNEIKRESKTIAKNDAKIREHKLEIEKDPRGDISLKLGKKAVCETVFGCHPNSDQPKYTTKEKILGKGGIGIVLECQKNSKGGGNRSPDDDAIGIALKMPLPDNGDDFCNELFFYDAVQEKSDICSIKEQDQKNTRKSFPVAVTVTLENRRIDDDDDLNQIIASAILNCVVREKAMSAPGEVINDQLMKQMHGRCPIAMVFRGKQFTLPNNKDGGIAMEKVGWSLGAVYRLMDQGVLVHDQRDITFMNLVTFLLVPSRTK
jgi:hypothetical protein